MTQRKFVFMKFEDSLFLHFSEFFGEGAPVEVQVVGEALAVEGDRKGVGAGFGRLRGEVDQHALADRLWCSAENAVGEGKIFSAWRCGACYCEAGTAMHHHHRRSGRGFED